MNNESVTLDYKRAYTEDIKKTIIAFANTSGGSILIGVDDDGSAVGVADTDDVMLRVTNAARDAILPDITLFMTCEVKEIDGKRIVAVAVQKGTASPYYLASKGIRPEGVYVRQGASTVPATSSAILKMIRETGGDDFEATRTLNQNLSFSYAETYFEVENLPFGDAQKRTLGLIGEDGAYTNLGQLLSDQCAHSIKAAVFQGSKKTVFKDRTEFSGSLLRQLEDAFRFLDRYNRTRAEIAGLKRVDIRDYPVEAIREALLNAVVHREYSYSGSTLISIFDDRIELLSLGGLPKGISESDMLLGVSVLRNRRLAEIFYRLHLIEAYGTGMPKIHECYRDCKRQPLIETTENAFKITLPNVNFIADDEPEDAKLSAAERAVFSCIQDGGTATRSQIEDSTGFSQSVVIRSLRTLLDLGMIEKLGSGKLTKYRLSADRKQIFR